MLSTRGQWDAIYGLVGWLDRANGRDKHEVQMRLMKLAEEVGEVTAAYIGMQGLNPRKGVTHTREDLCDELADVMIAAAVALATVADRDPADILAEKIAKVADRSKKAEAAK